MTREFKHWTERSTKDFRYSIAHDFDEDKSKVAKKGDATCPRRISIRDPFVECL